MKNNGITILSDNGMVRGFFLNSKDIVQRAFELHQTAPVVTAGLGRLLTVATMIGKTLKNDSDLVTLQIEGEGPVRSILATAERHGRVKGYAGANIVDIPLNAAGKLDVRGAIGPGYLTVLRDNGEGEPYVSRTELVSGEIAEDITHYYALSEQTPTVCALGVLVDRNYSVKSAGGFLVQLLPGADDETISKLEENLSHLHNVSAMFEHTSNREIADILMKDISYHVTEEWCGSYHCNCSKQKTEKVLLSIGKKDLAALIEEGNDVELCCSFCSNKYKFTPKEMENLLIESLKNK